MEIHPTAIVHSNAKLGKNVSIGPYCIIGSNVTLEDHVKLISHVNIGGHTFIDEHCILYPFVSLGFSPQIIGYKKDQCRLIIGKKNILREHVTMHVGSKNSRQETCIGNHNYFMVGAHVAHDCYVGNHVVFANNAGIAGHVHVEDHAFLGGRCSIHQNVRVGKQAFISGMSAVADDIIPYSLVSGNIATLNGLNIIGMKRKNISPERLYTVRNAYKTLFLGEGLFKERIKNIKEKYSDCLEVRDIINFIHSEERSRQLCFPSKSKKVIS